jgi:8-oxo-dGTP pyrophosphatase MutT (NUDIX family)
MTEAELPARTFPNLRPRDAATLIILRRDPDTVRVLMGRRSKAHAFMPGAVVFPGGRVDREDCFAPSLDDLHPDVQAKLDAGMRRPSPARARAIALAAIRETFEEAGILIGRPGAAVRVPKSGAWSSFLTRGIVPTLAPMRLVARAITPPRMSRRFDTRFFAVSADAIGATIDLRDGELQSPAWLSFEAARAEKLPSITRAVLDSLEPRMSGESHLRTGGPVPFYFVRRGRPCLEEF